MKQYKDSHRQENHSPDGLDFIHHTGDHAWVVFWRGLQNSPPLFTRETARRVIRRLKARFRSQQLSFDF